MKVFGKNHLQGDNDVINTHISNLRKKLKAKAAELRPYGAWVTDLQSEL